MATNSMLDVKSLANDLNKLMLDDNIASDASYILSALGINRDVLSYWMNGKTNYDNKNTALLDFVQSVIQAKGDDFGNTWTTRFGYQDQGKRIVVKYDHLPIMAEIERQRIASIRDKAEILKTLVDSGADFLTAAKLVNLDDLEASTQTPVANEG